MSFQTRVSTPFHVRMSQGASKNVGAATLQWLFLSRCLQHIIHNNQKVEIIDVPDEWMNKM